MRDKFNPIPFGERKHKMAKKKKAAKRKRALKGLWTTRELNLLVRLFPTTLTAKIAAKLGRPTDAVKKKASRMKLRKSKKYLRSIGKA